MSRRRSARRARPRGGARPIRTALRILLLLLLFAGSATLAAALIRTRVPWPRGSGLNTKVDYLAEHTDEVTVLFVGSSRTFRGLDPVLFDRTLKQLGVEEHSINLAVNGMAMFEVDYLVKRVLEHKPPRLRYVIFEWQPWVPDFVTPEIARSDRAIEWHDLEQTRLALHVTRTWPLQRDDLFELGLAHVRLFGARATNFGSGEAALVAWLGTEYTPPEQALRQAFAHRGWQSYDDDRGRSSAPLPSGETYTFTPAGWRSRIAGIDELNASLVPLHQIDLDPLRIQIAACEDARIVPIHVAIPVVAGDPLPYALAEAGEFRAFEGFNSPGRHPELYGADGFYDDGHLNERGARRYSVALARWFADWLRATDGR